MILLYIAHLLFSNKCFKRRGDFWSYFFGNLIEFIILNQVKCNNIRHRIVHFYGFNDINYNNNFRPFFAYVIIYY